MTNTHTETHTRDRRLLEEHTHTGEKSIKRSKRALSCLDWRKDWGGGMAKKGKEWRERLVCRSSLSMLKVIRQGSALIRFIGFGNIHYGTVESMKGRSRGFHQEAVAEIQRRNDGGQRLSLLEKERG